MLRIILGVRVKMPQYELLPGTPQEMDSQENEKAYIDPEATAYIEASRDPREKTTRTEQKGSFLERKAII